MGVEGVTSLSWLTDWISKENGGLKYREDGLFEWENFGWGERK